MRRTAGKAPGRGLRLELRPATRAWTPPRSRLSRWAAAALGRRGEGREIAVRVVGEEESRELNRTWRGKDKPTNVLSFPAPPLPAETEGWRPLGDLVICAPVLRHEAARDGKSLEAHWAHMVVHGALHLAGYDHEQGARERLRMERREIAVLRGFGIGNPYT